MKTKIQTLKGFRDFLPATMRVRNYCLNIFKQVFESFGFEPLETPTLEYASTLTGKYGSEASKLIYTFTDKGGRKVGLRYDLTVPTSKVLAIYQNKIPLPFKRYQIQPVWRADKPQKGRYREVLMCDIDSFGQMSPILDAEIITIIYQILSKLNFSDFSIRLNSRQVLNTMFDQLGINSDKNTVLQTIDKLNKIGQQGVTKELSQKGLSQTLISALFQSLKSIKPDQYLSQVIDQIKSMGVPQKYYIFDPSMVRGLDYYTGPIFETYVSSPKIGSITGGGRYDNLISTLGGPDIPAVGTTLGLDRIVDCIQELNLMPELSVSSTKALVTIFDDTTINKSLEIANSLRLANIPTFLYPSPDKLGKQFKFASDKKIPFVIVIGPDEVKNNTITLKNMITGTQQILKPENLVAQLV